MLWTLTDWENLCCAYERASRGAARLEKLQAADAELLKLRLYLRLCERWRWLSKGQYRHVSTMTAEIGKLLGGWLKATS